MLCSHVRDIHCFNRSYIIESNSALYHGETVRGYDLKFCFGLKNNRLIIKKGKTYYRSRLRVLKLMHSVIRTKYSSVI